MIRRRENGSYHCDGRECGYPLSWQDCDREDGASGEWICPDCWSSMFAEKPTPKHFDGAEDGGAKQAPPRAA